MNTGTGGLKVVQTPASLLPPDQKPAGPPPTPDKAIPGGTGPENVTPAYSEKWTSSIIRYFCNLAAAEWGPEMAATEIEIQLLTPPLMAVLNRHAPDVASGADERASLGFVALVLVIMGCRRGLIIRHKARAEAAGKGPQDAATGEQAKPAAQPKPAPAPRPQVVPEHRGTLMGGLLS